MIIKGSSRGQSTADTSALAHHLLSSENENSEILEIRGVTTNDLAGALEEMRLVSLGTRAKRGLYHSSINLDRDEAPTIGCCRWLAAADELERQLGLAGHQRAIVRHVKKGREHLHVVWSRVHPTTLKITRDSQNYKKHEEVSRTLEARWGLRVVAGVHTRRRGAPRPVAIATHPDWQVQERTSISVRDVAGALVDAWTTTKTGRALRVAVEREGFKLALGRRGIILVDAAGTPHSISRRMQMKVADVERRLSDIDKATLPTVQEIAALSRRPTGSKKIMQKKAQNTGFGACDTQLQRGRRPGSLLGLSATYWRALGYEVEDAEDVLRVQLPGSTTLEDCGDRITLIRVGEPTDDEIRILVTAGKSRGWESIRFFGGSENFQRRARVEALRQGYQPKQISLECEDGMPQSTAAAPLPEHIRRRLFPPAVPQPTRRPPSTPATPIPDREPRQ